MMYACRVVCGCLRFLLFWRWRRGEKGGGSMAFREARAPRKRRGFGCYSSFRARCEKWPAHRRPGGAFHHQRAQVYTIRETLHVLSELVSFVLEEAIYFVNILK